MVCWKAHKSKEDERRHKERLLFVRCESRQTQVAHTPARHHPARQEGRLDQIVLRPRGDVAARDFFRGPSSQQHDQTC